MAISYKGVVIPSFIKVKKVEFQVLPKIDLITSKVPKRTGLTFSGINMGEKKISLDFSIIPNGKTPMQLAEELAVWLRGSHMINSFETVGDLTLDDAPNRIFHAIVSSEVSVSDLIYVGEGTIEFLLADPYSYNTTEYLQRAFTVTSGSIIIPYSGSAPYYPAIFITVGAAVTNPRIDDVDTGDSIKLIGSFTAGQTIQIWNDAKKVYVNNAIRMDMLDFSSSWLYLSKFKTNKFSIVPANTATTLSVTYREAYL